MQCLIVLSCLCNCHLVISACNFLSVNAYYCHRVHTHLQLNIYHINKCTVFYLAILSNEDICPRQFIVQYRIQCTNIMRRAGYNLGRHHFRNDGLIRVAVTVQRTPWSPPYAMQSNRSAVEKADGRNRTVAV